MTQRFVPGAGKSAMVRGEPSGPMTYLTLGRWGSVISNSHQLDHYRGRLYAAPLKICLSERRVWRHLQAVARPAPARPERSLAAAAPGRLQQLAQAVDAAVEAADRAVETAQAARDTAAAAAVIDRLDRADRVALAADRELRRVLREIDAGYRALHQCRDGDRLAAGIGRGDRQCVLAVGLSDAVRALAVPGIALRAGVQCHGAAIDALAAGIGDRDRAGRRRRRVQGPGRRTIGRIRQRPGRAGDGDIGAEELHRLGRLGGLLQ